MMQTSATTAGREAEPLLLQPERSQSSARTWRERATSWTAVFGVLALVAFAGVGLHVTGGMDVVASFSKTGDGQLCTFSQVTNGLTLVQGAALGSVDPTGYGDGAFFFSKPGKPHPFSALGAGFQCGTPYSEWLKGSALFTPNNCELLTPPADQSPFGAPGQKVLMVGNSYMFQQVTALLAQYVHQQDFSKSVSGMAYYNGLSGEQKCKCVLDDAQNHRDECIDQFSRSKFDQTPLKGPEDFSGGDGFHANMVGPPATMGIYAFKDGTQLYTLTNHPLMNSDVFGLPAIAAAFETPLYEFDMIYMNYGNQRGFGRMFCGSMVDPADVRAGVGELNHAHVHESLVNGGFKGKLILTTKRHEEDIGGEFNTLFNMQAQSGAPWKTLLVPSHMHLTYDFCPYVAGDPEETCSTDPACTRKTCPTNSLEGCINGGAGHSCAPGFADVGVNLMLHALNMEPGVYFEKDGQPQPWTAPGVDQGVQA
jgi:hypothetical protein